MLTLHTNKSPDYSSPKRHDKGHRRSMTVHSTMANDDDPLIQFFHDLKKTLKVDHHDDDDRPIVHIVVDGAKMMPKRHSFTWKTMESAIPLRRSTSDLHPLGSLDKKGATILDHGPLSPSASIFTKSKSNGRLDECHGGIRKSKDIVFATTTTSRPAEEAPFFSTIKGDSLALAGQLNRRLSPLSGKNILKAATSPLSVMINGSNTVFSVPSLLRNDGVVGRIVPLEPEPSKEDQPFSDEWWGKLDAVLG